MTIRADEIVPWHERAFVTVAEAGFILSRSQSWVRDQIVAGTLVSASLPGKGPIAVTVASVLALIERAAPLRQSGADVAPSARCKNTPQLHLVVDNT